MKKAFEEAKYAFFKNEVPVGCVIVNNNDTSYIIDPSNASRPSRTWRYLDEVNFVVSNKFTNPCLENSKSFDGVRSYEILMSKKSKNSKPYKYVEPD